MKKLITLVTVLVFLGLSAEVAHAEEVCVQNYGQPVVCGVKTPEYHTPVKAGLGDINMGVVGLSFLTFAGVTYVISARKSSLSR